MKMWSYFKKLKLNSAQWMAVVTVFLLMVCWEAAARINLIPTIFFPAPTVIFSTIFRLTIDGKLVVTSGITLSRVLLGFFFGGLSGMILGLGMGWSRKLRSFFDPIIAAIHPIPKIAILPLIMIIFGIGDLSKIVVVGISTFFPMLINCMAGVSQINPANFQVAENYGAGPLKLFMRVILPGSLPMVLTGGRISLNLALLITIAVELVSAQKGLGAMVWLAWETLRIEELYASIVVVSILGIIFNFFFQYLHKRLVPWQSIDRSI